MGGAACFHCFLVSTIWNILLSNTSMWKCTFAGPFGATSGTKTQRRPLTKFGSHDKTLKLGPFCIFLVFLVHIFSLPRIRMHFLLGVLLPRLKTLLTSCNPLRGPAFYRPFVKLDTAY